MGDLVALNARGLFAPAIEAMAAMSTVPAVLAEITVPDDCALVALSDVCSAYTSACKRRGAKPLAVDDAPGLILFNCEAVGLGIVRTPHAILIRGVRLVDAAA